MTNKYPPQAFKTKCGELTSAGQLTNTAEPSLLKQTEKSQINNNDPKPSSLLNGLYVQL